MDPNAFQKELQKYKVVRLEDHYKPRIKKNETRSIPLRHQVEKKYNEKDKSNNVVEVKETGPQKEQSFWALLEAKLNEVLTPNEVVKFIAEMKKNIKDVPSIINLEDLDNAAGVIVYYTLCIPFASFTTTEDSDTFYQHCSCGALLFKIKSIDEARKSKMQNDAGETVDLYIPRKCSWSNRILAANDHGAIQLNIANIDPVTGLYTKSSTTIAISGFLRAQSEGDEAVTSLVRKIDAKASVQ